MRIYLIFVIGFEHHQKKKRFLHSNEFTTREFVRISDTQYVRMYKSFNVRLRTENRCWHIHKFLAFLALFMKVKNAELGKNSLDRVELEPFHKVFSERYNQFFIIFAFHRFLLNKNGDNKFAPTNNVL